jgi:tetrahydrodipicolinate N-succinyltransferase
MKIRSLAFAGLMAALSLASFSTTAAEDNLKTIAALNQNKAALAGKTISAQGKVVKVNNGIMGRNFVHIQDGTGDATSNNLIVTSKQTANVGDQVSISGTVVVNRDFGSGYSYPLLIEEASITPKK